MSDFKLGPIQEAWLKSLEEHPERQCKEVLGRKIDDSNYVACCLGQGGLICGGAHWDGNILMSGGGFSQKTLIEYNKLGLYGSLGEAKGQNDPALSRLNDDGKTWPEIAAIIRANPELYLSKSV